MGRINENNLNYISFPEFMGNDLVSNKIELDYNQFFGMPNKRDVLAIRLFAGAGIGELDFNQQYGVGETDIRGVVRRLLPDGAGIRLGRGGAGVVRG